MKHTATMVAVFLSAFLWSPTAARAMEAITVDGRSVTIAQGTRCMGGWSFRGTDGNTYGPCSKGPDGKMRCADGTTFPDETELDADDDAVDDTGTPDTDNDGRGDGGCFISTVMESVSDWLGSWFGDDDSDADGDGSYDGDTETDCDSDDYT